jgi:hypothetical protein
MGYQKVAQFDDGHRDGVRSVGNRGTEKVTAILKFKNGFYASKHGPTHL